MKRTISALVVLLLLVGVPGCAPVDDQKAVLTFIEQYFEVLKKCDYAALSAHYNPMFYDNVAQEQWNTKLIGINKKFGSLNDYSLSGRNVDYTSGYTSGKLYFNLEYDMEYEKGSTHDTIIVRKIGNKIEIMSHQISEND